MATLFDDASLVMIPSGYKDDKLYSIKPTDGSGDFTFSRDGSGASPATRVNSAGFIEKGRTNLLLQSNQFDTTWINQLGTGTITSGQSGYDGTNNAWEITKDTSTYRSVRQAISASGVLTYSAYIKAGSLTSTTLRVDTTAGATQVTFDLTNGNSTLVGGVLITHDSVDIGNGWYRCIVSVNATITNVHIYVDRNGTTAGSIYIQNAQLEKGLVATNYIATTTAAESAGILGDMPRLDYSGGATCPSLLLEPARTNLATQSEYFDPVFNEASGVSWEVNATTSPEGIINAAKLNNSNASTQGAYNVSMSFTNNDTMVASIFAKAGTNNYLRFGITNQIESRHIYYNFNLAEGTFAYAAESGGMTSYSADIEDFGNGWYRCIVIGTFPSTGVTSGGVYPRIIGNGYLYLYGLQVEKNASYPTSYIPTHGSATARGADQLETSPYNYYTNGILGANVGTIFIDVDNPGTSTGSNDFHMFGEAQSIADGYLFRWNSGSSIDILERDANATTAQWTSIAAKQQHNKIAVSYDGSSVYVYVNGVAKSVSSGTPQGGGNIQGFSTSSSNKAGLNIKQIILFPTQLSTAELAALTTL